MKRVGYPAPVESLIGELKRLPGIGPRSAERIALWMIQNRNSHPERLEQALRTAIEQVQACEICGYYSLEAQCEICKDNARGEFGTLCVVEQPEDILSLERVGIIQGRYHALGGKISPLDHLGPEDLRIEGLLSRLSAENVEEVILALSADVEGDATSHYLADLIRPLGVKISRIAQGLPAGGGLNHTDEVTLSRAISGRVQF